jgi:hypothetical protein
MHVVICGAVASLIAPFVLTQVLSTVADYWRAGAAANFTLSMAMAMLPLAIVLGLPVTLVSAIAFAWIALKRQPPPEPEEMAGYHGNVQPFR